MANPRMSRAERVEEIRRVEREHPGSSRAEQAELLGITRSTLNNLLTDPDGSKQAARRAGYTGVCEGCGGETKSDGSSRGSRLCARCSKPTRYWTRERVIAAIQAWAAEHGEPPTAYDWQHADPDGRWPAASSVYGGPSRGHRARAFPSWADAVEAAGFPRPRTGVRRYTDRHRQQVKFEADSHSARARRVIGELLGEGQEIPERDLRVALDRAGVSKDAAKKTRAELGVVVAHGLYPTVRLR